jgi:hypothetical protein
MAATFQCLYCNTASSAPDGSLVCPSCGAPYIAMDGRSLNALLAPGAMNRVLGAIDLRSVGLQPLAEQPAVGGDAEEMIVASWPTGGGGRGDVELDLIDAHADDAAEVVATCLSEGGGQPSPVQIDGAEEAYVAQTRDEAGVTARQGALIIVLSIPPGPQAAQQVIHLAGLVLQRLAA